MKPWVPLLIMLFSPAAALALGTLEVPRGLTSGIGIVAGWKCAPAGSLTVAFDGGSPLPLVKGVQRGDTAVACGNGGLNGFLAEYNYNLLGDGHHTARVFDNGVQFDATEFDVKTLGEPFRRGLAGSTVFDGFPGIGEMITLTWDEGIQGFVLSNIGLSDPAPIFHDNFEGGVGLWSVDNGVWEIGLPTSGPNGCHQGVVCAGTVLGGDYPSIFNSRLVSPSIELPQLGASGEIQLRFWEWHVFHADGCDLGNVQVQEYDSQAKTWSNWRVLDQSQVAASSNVWSVKAVDLSGSAGKRVRVGFYAQASDCNYDVGVGPGWYIDQVDVISVP